MTILGAVMTNIFSKKFGKPKCYYGFLGIATIATAIFYVLKSQNLILMFVLQIISSFAVGPVSVLQWAIYTDTADYSEWKTGRRATALIMAASLFCLKLGIALAGTFQAWVLDKYGFVANVAQTATSLNGIKLLMSIYPAIAGIIGTVLMLFYPLDKQMMTKIETELIERRRKIE
jgi:GPH family glycoside/pentoside/hexuronide:cation symporter